MNVASPTPSDLVAELRSTAEACVDVDTYTLCSAAADAIEWLESEVVRLKVRLAVGQRGGRG